MSDQQADTDEQSDEERIDAILAARRATNQPGGDPNSTDPIEMARTARQNRNAR